MMYRTVLATIRSDDGHARARFDATPWFEMATEVEVERLRREGWGGGETSDRIALDLDPMPRGVRAIFDHIDLANGAARDRWRRDTVGFQVDVVPESAAWWLARHRPEWGISQDLAEAYEVDMLVVLADIAAETGRDGDQRAPKWTQ